VEIHGKSGQRRSCMIPLAVTPDGRHVPSSERRGESLFRALPARPRLSLETRLSLFRQTIEPMLRLWKCHRGSSGTSVTESLISVIGGG